jgi:hypothetical protein
MDPELSEDWLTYCVTWFWTVEVIKSNGLRRWSWLMSRQRCGRRLYWPSSQFYRIIHAEIPNITTKILKIASDPANIKKERLPSASLECCRYTKLLIMWKESDVLRLWMPGSFWSAEDFGQSSLLQRSMQIYRSDPSSTETVVTDSNISHFNKWASIIIKEPYSSEDRAKCIFSITATWVIHFRHDMPLSGSVQDHSSGLIILL